MGKPELAMQSGIRSKLGHGAPVADREHFPAALSFAAYTAGRPDPLDGVERFLLRLGWLAWRVARRSAPPPRDRSAR